MKRIPFIDVLKIIALFGVVYRHNDLSSQFSIYIQSFCLALFFISSGFVSSSKSHLPFRGVLKKQSKHLLIPYFLLSGILYLFWLFVGRHYGDKALQMHDPLDNLIGIFYAQGGNDYMNWGIPMWFLPAMFVVVMIDYFVGKLRFPFRVLVALILPFAGIGINSLLSFHLPWSADVALVVYLFYFIGRIFKKVKLLQLISGKELLVFICFFCCIFWVTDIMVVFKSIMLSMEVV